MNYIRPRIKPIYPVYRLDDQCFRVGGTAGYHCRVW